MNIRTGSVNLNARDVACGDVLNVQHVRVESQSLHLTVPIGTGPWAASLTVELTIEEGEINRLLKNHVEGGLRDLRIALMEDSLRITGRYEIMGPLAAPFTLVAVPRVEAGERVQLDIRDLSLVGAALPGFTAQMIGDRLNARLAEFLNVQRLPVPLRLVSVNTSTGRLNVVAEMEIEWRPDTASALRRTSA